MAQGFGWKISGTDTFFFMNKNDVLADHWKDATYACFICDGRPQKVKINRSLLAIGGDRIHYPDKCGTPTADILLVKISFSYVVSTPEAKFRFMD